MAKLTSGIGTIHRVILEVVNKMQMEILNEFRHEVGQSTALRALASSKHDKYEKKFAYIKKFDLVCTRFVGTMLHDDTLKQVFIQGFCKAGTIRGGLEMNLQTLADAKVACEVESPPPLSASKCG